MVGMNGSVSGQKSSLSTTTVAEIYFTWRASISLAHRLRGHHPGATEPLAEIHHRHPMLLDEQHLDWWLNGGQKLEGIADPKISVHPVSTRVGNTRNDDSELIVPVDLDANEAGQTADLFS